jgi:hypothetical protein
MKPVRVRRDPAHGVDGYRPAHHVRVAAAGGVRPGLLEHHGLLEGHLDDFIGKAADGRGGNAAALGHRLRRVLGGEIPLGEQREGGAGVPSVGQHERAAECRIDAGRAGARERPGGAIEGELAPLRIARDEPVLGAAGIVDDQMMRVRVAHEEFGVDLARLEQTVNEREDQEPVGARGQRDELIGDRRITGAHRIEGDDLRATRLEAREAELDRIGIVVFRHPEEQKQPRVLPVRLAELPERPAERIKTRRGHVDRAEPAVGGVIDRAEHAREVAREGLRLIAAGEQREAARVARADRREALGDDAHRLVPRDGLEGARSARSDALQRCCQARR